MAAMGEAVREMERVTVSAMVRCGLNEAGCGVVMEMEPERERKQQLGR